MLRPYQQRAIDMLYEWFGKNSTGNPCLELPTGAGKSHIIAALIKDALQNWPDTTVLMLTHVKELIEQNAEKMRQHWPGAPMGIYSASIGRKVLGEPITFAGIQSIRGKADKIGHIDLCIIDECHLVNHKEEGGYRTLINDLRAINPQMRVIGLTASPYRLGHGCITDKPALFDDIVSPVTISELIHKGFLAPLRSKVTRAKLETDGVHKRGGEFIESELQKAVDTRDKNVKVVREVIELAGDRKAWLFFCVGVAHAEHIAGVLLEHGIPSAYITGQTSKSERERLIAEFKSGRLRALTNANVLTTGFDYPDIDLIAMLRPTMSPSLYIQMAGRGMRVKSHTDHCLVLDFAGVVEQHGPIVNVRPPKKKGEGDGVAPVKSCPECAELVHISVMTCTACGFKWPPPEPKDLKLHDVDIMGDANGELTVGAWKWTNHVSQAGNEMVKVTYYGKNLSDTPVTEYFAFKNPGYAGQIAIQRFAAICRGCGVLQPDGLQAMNNATPPLKIRFRKDGKFYRVVEHKWTE